MSKIQRYNHWAEHGASRGEKDDLGEWVRFADHCDSMRAETHELAMKLHAANNELMALRAAMRAITRVRRDATRYRIIRDYIAPRELYDNMAANGKAGEWRDLPTAGSQSIYDKIDELCDEVLRRSAVDFLSSEKLPVNVDPYLQTR